MTERSRMPQVLSDRDRSASRTSKGFHGMPESRKVLALVDQGYVRLSDMPAILDVTKQR